jgi:hypothetical protein
MKSDILKSDSIQLWQELSDRDSQVIRGGGKARRCRWVRGWGVVCETELDTITL